MYASLGTNGNNPIILERKEAALITIVSGNRYEGPAQQKQKRNKVKASVALACLADLLALSYHKPHSPKWTWPVLALAPALMLNPV